MQILVLGASGFIGGHIAKVGLKKGWRVRGLQRGFMRTGHVPLNDLEWVIGDLDDYQSLVYAMHYCDVVFHAAGFYPKRGEEKDPAKDRVRSANQMNNVIKAAKENKVKRLVYTSSLSTIGSPAEGEDRLPDERDHYQAGDIPSSSYYESKIVMESAALKANNAQLEVVVLNPTAVFGPGDVNLTLGGMLIMSAKGRAVASLPGIINVVDVRDVAEAHIQAAEKGTPGHRYIIGGHNYTTEEALSIAAKVTGNKPPKFKIPLTFVDILAYISELFPKLPLPSNHLRGIRKWKGFNTQKAEKELGTNPRPFEETVKDALAWFKDNGLI